MTGCDYKGKKENGDVVIGECHEGKCWFNSLNGYALCPVCSRPVVNKVKKNLNTASQKRETQGESIERTNK